MLPMLLSLFVSPAQASAEIAFDLGKPALVYVDGKQAALTGPTSQRVRDLEPGTHEVRIMGVFGKTLFEAEMDIPDNTLTTTRFAGGELSVVATDWLEEAPEEVAAAKPEPEPELPLAIAEPAPEPVARKENREPPVEAPVKLEAAPPLAATSLPAVEPGRTMAITAAEGMRIEVTHGDDVVTLIVEDGEFRLVDPTGMEVRFGR